MPPVAREEPPTLEDVLDDLISRRVNGIRSVRQLAKRLQTMKGTTVEGERRSITRHMQGENAEEETIDWYAKAFDVDRSVFPPASASPVRRVVSVAEFQDVLSRLEDLEQIVAEIRGAPSETPNHPEAGTL